MEVLTALGMKFNIFFFSTVEDYVSKKTHMSWLYIVSQQSWSEESRWGNSLNPFGK